MKKELLVTLDSYSSLLDKELYSKTTEVRELSNLIALLNQTEDPEEIVQLKEKALRLARDSMTITLQDLEEKAKLTVSL